MYYFTIGGRFKSSKLFVERYIKSLVKKKRSGCQPLPIVFKRNPPVPHFDRKPTRFQKVGAASCRLELSVSITDLVYRPEYLLPKKYCGLR